MADLFDIAVAKKLSGGGGGGSSDFSTATVTLVDVDEVGALLYGAFCSTDTTEPECYTDDGSATIVLYKGKATINGQNVVFAEATISVSGNAELDPKGDIIYVTGDCTITIS